MKKIVLLSIVAIALLAVSCKKSKTGAPNAPDVKESNAISISLLRLDRDMAAIDVNNPMVAIPSLQRKYGSNFTLFTDGILGIGKPADPNFRKGLYAFLTYPVVQGAFSEVAKKYDSKAISSLEKDLAEAFSLYKGTFPQKKIPALFFTYVAGFNQSVIITDNALGIGLDKYLGSSYASYVSLGFPRYMLKRMEANRIVLDAVYAWANGDFPIKRESEPLLSHMIYQGKLAYLVSQMVPEVSDTLLFGFSKDQVKWCKKNERMMWEYLIGQKLLFNTEAFVRTKFVEDAPFTNVYSSESPGKAAVWQGFQIVAAYVRNTGASLNDLMAENDYQKILSAAKYRP